ncbi:hypothetical protein HHI36_014752 [Cryptolaemus montrouzieri]|uniref:Uncharacterized protein n=1 Tax=Cryptolaemus montrouzieri TaxID=559131 RepID=A0ABD2N3R9_9CUCU
MKKSIVNLIDVLKAEHYNLPVAATNMGNMLKQVCNVAPLYMFRKSDIKPTVNTANIESDLKTLIQIINGNWKFDESSQAANDLNIKK